MSIKRLVRRTRSRSSNCLRALYRCEALEPRTLLNAVPAVGMQVVIQGDGGDDTITLSSHSDRTGIRQFVDWSITGGPSPSTNSVAVFPTDSVFVETGGGKVTVNVKSTVAAVPTAINNNLSPAIDTLNLGGPSGLQGIHGTINVTSSAGLWNITADDSSDTTSRTGTLIDGSLTGLAPANITWDPSKCHGLGIVTSSAGGNTLSALQTNVPTGIVADSSGADDSLTVGNSTDGLADITAALSISSVAQVTPARINLTLDDQADPVFGDYVLDNGSLGVGTNSFTTNITWTSSVMRSVTLETEAQVSGQGPSTAEVVNTIVPTMVVGDSAGLQVDVGKPLQGSPLGIHGNLYVTNPAGGTRISVQPGAAVAPTVMLHTISVPGDSAPYGAIDGLTPATIAYKYADAANVAVGAGVPVQVAATGTDVFIEGSPAVTVGDAGSLQNIAGTVGILGPAATVDDSADPTPRNATISLVKPGASLTPSTIIGGLGPSSIAFFSAHAGTLTIDGGTANNTYTVDAPPLTLPPGSLMPDIAVVLNTGSGKDTVQLLATGFGQPLTVNGQGGNDAFTVNYSNSIIDNLIFNGGLGSDTLTLMGPTAGAQFSVTPGTVTFGTLTTTYTAINTLALATGTFTIDGDLGGVNLNASGTTILKSSTHVGALNIGDGVQFAVAPSPVPLGITLFCTALSIAATADLDLTNNALQLTYAGTDPSSTVRSYLTSGYHFGSWEGDGIITSASDATHSLGFGDSADGIVAGLPANTISIRWTRLGDVNLDGKVGFADLVAVARNYGKSGLNWDQGDINYDSSVGFDDLIAVARNYGATAALQSASAMLAAAPLEMPIKTRKRREPRFGRGVTTCLSNNRTEGHAAGFVRACLLFMRAKPSSRGRC